MRQHKTDTRIDSKTERVYNRNVYQCMGDDVWLTLEIPVGHSSQYNYDTNELVID